MTEPLDNSTPPGRGIASVGECMLELSGRENDQWAMGFGGDAFNTLWTLRALVPRNVPCDFVSGFGDDPFSRDQIDFFSRGGIGVAHSPKIAGARPGLYAITLEGAERSFTYWRSQSAARALASDPDALMKSLENRALIYLSGITLAILERDDRAVLLDVLRSVRSRDCRIAFDPNYRPRLWTTPEEARLATQEALGLSDIALPTFSDQQALFGDTTPHQTVTGMRSAGVGEIVVKDGSDPALIAHPGRMERIEAIEVRAPVDTTGAGDAFNGAYLAARLDGDEPGEAARKAHRVAGAVVQVRGALAPPETLRAAFGKIRSG